MSTSSPVVVGIDGGPASVATLGAALREASLRRVPVVAVTCWPVEPRHDASAQPPCETFDDATELLEQVIAQATCEDPLHVPVIREVSQSFAGPTLVAASRHADLLVLGCTTRGPAGRRRGRQTIEHCLRYGESPVLVVPWPIASCDENGVRQSYAARGHGVEAPLVEV